MEETAALFDGEEVVDQIHVRGLATSSEKDTKEFLSEKGGLPE